MLGGLGTQELLIILAIIIVVFGASKLPQIGAGMGKGIKNFKKEMKQEEKTVEQAPEKEEESKEA